MTLRYNNYAFIFLSHLYYLALHKNIIGLMVIYHNTFYISFFYLGQTIFYT